MKLQQSVLSLGIFAFLLVLLANVMECSRSVGARAKRGSPRRWAVKVPREQLSEWFAVRVKAITDKVNPTTVGNRNEGDKESVPGDGGVTPPGGDGSTAGGAASGVSESPTVGDSASGEASPTTEALTPTTAAAAPPPA